MGRRRNWVNRLLDSGALLGVHKTDDRASTDFSDECYGESGSNAPPIIGVGPSLTRSVRVPCFPLQLQSCRNVTKRIAYHSMFRRLRERSISACNPSPYARH